MRESSFDDVKRIFDAYKALIEDELFDLISNWPADLSDGTVRRVLGALIARQATLAVHVVDDPFFWNADVGPLVLRPLLENWLKIEWILQSPRVRSAGIAKADITGARLRVEALSATTRNAEAQAAGATLLEILRNEEQIFSEEEGKPLMIDSREMARKVGGDSLFAYRRHHVRMSSCAHSAWNHIARYNLMVNPNPLHRYNFIPIWKEPTTDLNFPLLAADYYDKAARAILRLKDATPSYERLIEDLQEIGIVQNLAPDEDVSPNSAG